MRALRAILVVALAAAWCGGCGGSAFGCSGGDDLREAYCPDLVESWQGGALPGYVPLGVPEIQTVMGQAVEQSIALGALSVTAVVDREGFVLGVYAMTGAPLGPGFPVPATSAPDALPGINAAIAKARTAAFLSSGQNAFSSRTAAFIVDKHFPPGILYTPGGPLYGVQNSNDTNTDVLRGVGPGGVPNSNNPAPLPNPNGFSGLPGGLPLYKDGILVGAVGVSGDVPSSDEKAAVAGTRGFAAPHEIRGCEMFVDGIRLEFAKPESPYVVATSAFAALPGAVVDATTQGPGVLAAGAAPPAFPAVVHAGVTGQQVYPVIDSPLAPLPKLLAADVALMLDQAAAAMFSLRAGIRLPLGSRAQVTTVVVDTAGNILGVWRPADCTRFSLDVAVQKARTVVAYSDGVATASLGEPISGLPLDAAVTTRALGFMAQPHYPPGIDGTPPGLLFGIQEALPGGTGAGIPGLDVTPGVVGDATDGNGITIFPGGIPLYKAGVLVGGIGVSGDGVDQDDYVADAGSRGFQPPSALRCDGYEVLGIRLPFVKFPRSPTEGVR